MLISELGINVSPGEANVGDVPSPRGDIIVTSGGGGLSLPGLIELLW